MITWMQRHKKWLVITIWISVIAFVGAGFVGWGSYDYSKKSGTIAKVGDREVSLKELQNEYSNLYAQYSSIYGEQFNDEVAKQLNLEQVAISRTIQNAQVLGFADELGLVVTDKEVAQELVKVPQFTKEGKFDKETYIKVLSQNRLNTKDYEMDLKKSILLKKTASLFDVKANQSEIELLNALLQMEDNIEIYVLEGSKLSLNYQEEALRAFWEENKNNYLSEEKFEYAVLEEKLVTKTFDPKELESFYNDNKTIFRKADGKLMALEEAQKDIIKELQYEATKQLALRKYIDLKKEKLSFTGTVSYTKKSFPFDAEDLEKVTSAMQGEVLKPIRTQEGYVVLKLKQKIAPQPLSFEEAKTNATAQFENSLRNQMMEKKSAELLKELNAGKLAMTKIGYVSTSSVDKFEKVSNINQTEAMEFLNGLFATTSGATGAISLKYSIGSKTVLYKIVDQKLGSSQIKDDKSKEMVSSGVNNIKNSVIFSNLTKKLEYRYETQVFLEGKN